MISLPCERRDPSRDEYRVAINGAWSPWLKPQAVIELCNLLKAHHLVEARDCTCDDPDMGHICDYHDLLP